MDFLLFYIDPRIIKTNHTADSIPVDLLRIVVSTTSRVPNGIYSVLLVFFSIFKLVAGTRGTFYPEIKTVLQTDRFFSPEQYK